MEIETSLIENHKVKLTVTVDDSQVEEAKQKAARKLARKAKIPGFRPGKAPYPIILRHFGDGVVMEEAIELLVNEIYPDILGESGFKTYGPGSLENIPSTQPLVLEFSVPLEAEVTLGDYQSIRVPYNPPKVIQNEIDEVIGNLQDRYAVLETVDRPAQKGDQVSINIEGRRINADEGEETQLIQQQSIPIIVKVEDDPNEWPFPGFSLHLIDCKEGDEKTIHYEYTEDTAYQQLVGTNAEFTFQVQEVSSRTLPVLNDEFAKTIGDFSTYDSLIEDIRSSLESNKKASYDDEYEEGILNEIIQNSDVQFPPEMLDSELNLLMQNFERRLSDQNLDMDLYLKTRQMSIEELREEYKPTAEERLKRSLVLFEISEVENIKVSQEELTSETSRTVDSLTNMLDKKDSRRLSSKDVLNNIAGNIMVDLLTKKTLERIRMIASGELENIDSENDVVVEIDQDDGIVISDASNEGSTETESVETEEITPLNDSKDQNTQEEGEE